MIAFFDMFLYPSAYVNVFAGCFEEGESFAIDYESVL